MNYNASPAGRARQEIENLIAVLREFRRCIAGEKIEGDHIDENEFCEEGTCFWIGERTLEIIAKHDKERK